MPECRTVRHPVSPVPEWTKMPMPGPVRYRNKGTQSGTGLIYRMPECRCPAKGESRSETLVVTDGCRLRVINHTVQYFATVVHYRHTLLDWKKFSEKSLPNSNSPKDYKVLLQRGFCSEFLKYPIVCHLRNSVVVHKVVKLNRIPYLLQ